MNEIKKTKNSLAEKKQIRNTICAFEQAMSEVPGAIVGDSDVAPLTHRFAPGIYVREIFLPKGFVCVGKIHKHDHPNFLMSGKVEVATEDGGLEILEAPMVMISPAGTKRAVHALEDVIWVTVHSNPTNTTDLAQIEEEIIAKSYDELEHKELECHS